MRSKIMAYRLIRDIIYSQILVKNAAVKIFPPRTLVILRNELFTKGDLPYSPDSCETCTLHTNRYPPRNDKTRKVSLLASRCAVQR
jgi:hypothetical protein